MTPELALDSARCVKMCTRVVALLAGASLIGCATSPIKTSLPPLPANLESFTGSPFGVPPGEWWKQLNQDPNLAKLIEAALTNSPNLQAAIERIEEARAGLRAAAANRKPYVAGSATVTGGLPVEPLRSGETGRTALPSGVEGALASVVLEPNYDLDLFGRLASDQEAAAARLEAASADAGAVRLSLVTDVARNYVAAWAANARARIGSQILTALHEELALSRTRVKAGLDSGLDEAEVVSRALGQEALLASVKGERGVRVAALSTLTGLSPTEIRQLVTNASDEPRFGRPASGVPSQLIARRPDIRAAINRVAAADADVASALAARFPSLTITSAIGLMASTTFGGLLPGRALGLGAGPSLTAPLLDFGRNQSEVERRRSLRAQAVAHYHERVLLAFGEVERSLAILEASERSSDALTSMVSSADAAAKLERVRYRRGLVDFSKVLAAEQVLLGHQSSLIQANAGIADTQIDLFKAVGGDLEGAPSRR